MRKLRCWPTSPSLALTADPWVTLRCNDECNWSGCGSDVRKNCVCCRQHSASSHHSHLLFRLGCNPFPNRTSKNVVSLPRIRAIHSGGYGSRLVGHLGFGWVFRVACRTCAEITGDVREFYRRDSSVLGPSDFESGYISHLVLHRGQKTS